ncbi:type II secretion system F family protein [bacterium]|nr:MAG: type II secretion system F family protein [bacterium]
MRKFTYEAKDSSTDKIVKATVQADSERSAAKLLIDQGFAPIVIKEQRDGESFFGKISNRITTKDRVVFTRQLSTLIAAGLPFAQSLRTVLEQTPNKRLQGVIQEIVASVEGGRSLHESFAKHPAVFDKLFLALVASGEASGTLDDALQRVANQQEKDAAIVGKIRGAMVYPLIVLVVIIGVMGFMLLTVVPQVEKLYQDLNQELPFLTMAMVAISQFLIKFWWLVLIALGLLGYFSVQYLKTVAGVRMTDQLKLNVPGFNGMFRRLYMARFARTTQTLLVTGVAMLDALRISSEAVSNSVISDRITAASEQVKGGKALSAALSTQSYIPELLPQMVRIGEQSGRIDEMLGKTAKIYEDELDQEIQSISTAIEPILMVVLAVMAGGMVAAILLPIYGLVNTMNI